MRRRRFTGTAIVRLRFWVRDYRMAVRISGTWQLAEGLENEAMEDVEKHTVYLLYFGRCQKKVAMEEVDY